MKIRNGFVSNSSSSSFIIRGVKMKKEDLIKIWNLTNESADDYELLDLLASKSSEFKLNIQDTRYYFGGNKTDDCIVGVYEGEMSDGAVRELNQSEQKDEEIADKLNKSGIKIDKSQLRFFVQYVSNDNY